MATTKTLAPGEYQDLSVTAPGVPEPVELLVTADPDSAVSDGKRANNIHNLSFVPCGNEDNRAPRFLTAPATTAVVGVTWSYEPAATDPDGDPFVFALTTAPSGMATAATTGRISWTPALEQIGLQEVAVTVSDGRGGTDAQLFVVEVHAPPLTGEPPPPTVSNLILSVTTDMASYGPGESVVIDAALQNESSAGRAGSFRLEVQDATGTAIGEVLATETVVFTGSGTQAKNATFSTGLLLPGSYAAVAIYTEGAAETRAAAPFTVTGSPSLAVSVTTEHGEYGANETVRIMGRMQNSSLNAPIEGLVPKLIVLDGSSAVLLQKDFASVDVGPSSEVRQELLFPTGTLPPGEYRARFEVEQSGVIMASAESHFTIAASAARGAALSGDVACNPGAVVIGATVAVTGSMTNIGNALLSGLDVRLQLVDPISQQVLREQRDVVELAIATATSKEAIFSTLGLTPQSYIARLQVTLGERTLLSTATELLVEAGPPPTVSIAVPPCGTADVVPVIIQAGGAPPVSTVPFLDAQPYDGQPVTSEGVHVIEVQVTDGIGRTAWANAQFIIDRAAPAIAVSGFAEGGYYNASVTPVVVIDEPHLSESSMALDGQPYQAGTAVNAEGPHTLLVTAQDCAGNSATRSASFTLDFSPPVLSITGVPACTSATTVTPIVTASEVASFQLTLDGAPFAVGDPIPVEGAHTLAAVATDRAGNQTAQEVGFIVDRTAPALSIAGVDNGEAYRVPVLPVVVAADANGVEVSATLNGQPFVSGTPVALDGSYQLLVSGTDCAGNTAAAGASFLIDTVAPTVQITGVEPCAGGPARPVVLASDPNWPDVPVSLACMLDQQPLASCDGLVVDAEGSHTLTVMVTDAAGNPADASAFFTVDNTAPVIEVAGFTNGGAYNVAVAPLVSVVEANPVESDIALNGAPFASGTTVSAEGSYLLLVSARDCAGHLAGPQTWSFLIDTTCPEVLIDVPACNAGDVTPIITVTDSNSTSTTKLLDGSPYSGDPVTQEGVHTLVVTATDIAHNEGSTSAPFLIDRTKPHLSITGVEDGTNYPSSVTPVIMISDTNLAASSVTLNGAPFASGTTVSDAGSYTLAATASDCAGNRESQTLSFDIRLLSGGLAQGLVSDARVLLACESTACSPAVLRSTLTSLAIPFEEADSRPAWLAKLRSGRFNQVVLFEPNPAEDDSPLKELNEAVWLGDGLLFVKAHPDAMPSMRESLGLDYGGNLSSSSTVSLLAPLEPPMLTATGAGAKLKLAGATSVGCAGAETCTGAKDVVAGLYGRGLGRSVTLSWDTESSASAQLYQSALAACAPAPSTPLLPGGLVQVKVTVTNLGLLETTYVVDSMLPPGASTWEPLSRPVVLAGGAGTSFTLPVLLPQAVGPYVLATNLSIGGEWAELYGIIDVNTLALIVQRSVETIGTDVVAALEALQLSGGQASKRTSAVANVQAAMATATPASAIDQILQAIANVRAITAVDVTSIRIDLARLLRSYQLRWQP